jgi:hypothetical protein
MIANLQGHIAKPGFSALPVYHGFGHFGVYVLALTPMTPNLLCRRLKIPMLLQRRTIYSLSPASTLNFSQHLSYY